MNKGISVIAFAKTVKRHESTVRKIENDKRKTWSRVLVGQIAKGLGDKPSVIIRESPVDDAEPGGTAPGEIAS